MRRCDWATNDLAVRYHDEEWGVPVRDDRRWFEFLVLEGAQAGLSWDTILKKRERYREVFDGFDPIVVARYDGQKVESLLADPVIIRNRLKVTSAIQNARAFLQVQGNLAASTPSSGGSSRVSRSRTHGGPARRCRPGRMCLMR